MILPPPTPAMTTRMASKVRQQTEPHTHTHTPLAQCGFVTGFAVRKLACCRCASLVVSEKINLNFVRALDANAALHLMMLMTARAHIEPSETQKGSGLIIGSSEARTQLMNNMDTVCVCRFNGGLDHNHVTESGVSARCEFRVRVLFVSAADRQLGAKTRMRNGHSLSCGSHSKNHRSCVVIECALKIATQFLTAVLTTAAKH